MLVLGDLDSLACCLASVSSLSLSPLFSFSSLPLKGHILGSFSSSWLAARLRACRSTGRRRPASKSTAGWRTHVRGSGGMRVVVQNPFPDLERVCISGHHGRSRFVAYCTREPAHTRARSTRSLRTALPLTPPSPIRISKGCLLTPPAIRTRRRIARASSQASCTERCTRQPSPTTQPTPS